MSPSAAFISSSLTFWPENERGAEVIALFHQLYYLVFFVFEFSITRAFKLSSQRCAYRHFTRMGDESALTESIRYLSLL